MEVRRALGCMPVEMLGDNGKQFMDTISLNQRLKHTFLYKKKTKNKTDKRSFFLKKKQTYGDEFL